ncbi:alpha/beta hydrolase [Hyphomonas sp. NPDC076881]|uniref:alpha/beta hydrolase n=1 Tax=Hyphomonas sp. NPDC076881 TaxID=3390569 RepID=UPI003D04C43C
MAARLTRRQFGIAGIGAAGALTLGPASCAALDPKPAVPSPLLARDPLSHVDPELRGIAARMMENGPPPSYSAESLKSARNFGAAFAPPRLPDISVSEVFAPLPGDEPDVKLFVVNAKPGVSRPAILHSHGGGYILGKAAWEVGHLQALARDLDCVIVSVEYRLAPETRYQGSIEDNYAGLLWLCKNAEPIGADPTRIALLGESAGGGHSALLAITARDRGEVPVAFQALVYPMLDDRTGSTRMPPPFIGAFGWDAPSNRFGWEAFLGHPPGGGSVPVGGVPARIENLTGLPPAFIGVGGIDLFVSEDIEYGHRLIESGVPVELVIVPGAFHGFDRIAADTTIAKRFTKAKVNALRRAFGQPQEI